jgi:hypothetical protein
LCRFLPAAFLFLIPAPLHAQSIELTVTPKGSAAAGQPLPPGALPVLSVAVRNSGKTALGPVEISVRLEAIAAAKAEGWQQQGGALRSAIRSIAAGAGVERTLRLRVDTAPPQPSNARVLVEAAGPGGKTASAETILRVADCAGAYRARLANLRENLSVPMRDAAEEMRRADPELPARQFPYAGKRNSELARLERLAAAFAARRGGDAQMATEWFRYMILRWASELNAFASQSANPGLCANNYYQIAGYRQGLLPITKHIAAIHEAAEKSLELARKESGQDGGADDIVYALIKAAGLETEANGTNALASLAELRASLRNGRRLEADMDEKLSVAETAAWLAFADRRGQTLVDAIEQTLSTIATAHKETCVCAF